MADLILKFCLFVIENRDRLRFLLFLLNLWVQAGYFLLFPDDFAGLELNFILNYLAIDRIEIFGQVVLDQEQGYDEIVSGMIFIFIFFNFLLKIILYEIFFYKLMVRLAIILVPDTFITTAFTILLIRSIFLDFHFFQLRLLLYNLSLWNSIFQVLILL